MPPRRRPSGSPTAATSPTTAAAATGPEEIAPTSEPAAEEQAPSKTSEPGFVACETFDGARDGFEFKSGSAGTGYYPTGCDEAASGGDASTDETAPATKWRDPDDAGFDLESVPALSPEEIKASEDQDRERVARISAVRSRPPLYSSLRTRAAHALDGAADRVPRCRAPCSAGTLDVGR